MNDVKEASLPLEQIGDRARWDEFVAPSGGHVLQSYEWGELKSRFGWQAERWARVREGRIESAAQVLTRRLAPTATIAYVPRGPVNAGPEFLSELGDVFRARGAFLFKVEPNWQAGDSREGILREAGFLPSPETIQPKASIRIDLTASLEQILARMKSKWRYNIRLAEKKGVTVRVGTAADLPRFYELTQTTGERDRFGVHSQDYYRTAFELLTACGAARLLFAEYEGKSLAAIFVTAFGQEAIYLYGASGNEHRNVMPNHALHWAAIQWARSRGCSHYDLWGIPENAGGEDERLPDSLYQFKQGFGGDEVRYTGGWDKVYSPVRHWLYLTARRLRRSGLA